MIILHRGDHYEVVDDNGNFISSADTASEAIQEVALYLNENTKKSA